MILNLHWLLREYVPVATMNFIDWNSTSLRSTCFSNGRGWSCLHIGTLTCKVAVLRFFEGGNDGLMACSCAYNVEGDILRFS